MPVTILLLWAFLGVSQSLDCSFSSTYPKQYVAYHTRDERPAIDGRLDEPMWEEAQWTDYFTDISAPTVTTPPRFETRVKLRWDDEYLYVGAYVQEPHVWANITETCHCIDGARDQVIFHDNDFEIFVDPDGDTHYYYEYEVNALNATWDLCLNRPYSDGGHENSTRVFGAQGWDYQPWSSASPGAPPLKCAVFVDGAVNDPAGPLDRFWTVEVALPLQSLAQNNDATSPPKHGDFWRINFSRVEWHVTVVNGRYQKDPKYPEEDNWVWSPQGQVAMHLPEKWGMLQFSTEAPRGTPAVHNPEWPLRSVAMHVYYAEHAYAANHSGVFTDDVRGLKEFAPAGVFTCARPPVLHLSGGGRAFQATVEAKDATMLAVITHDRRLTVRRQAAAGKAEGSAFGGHF